MPHADATRGSAQLAARPCSTSFLFRAGPGLCVEPKDQKDFEFHQDEMLMRAYGRLLRWCPLVAAGVILQWVISKVAASEQMADMNNYCALVVCGLSALWLGSKTKGPHSCPMLSCASQCGVLTMLLLAAVSVARQGPSAVHQHRIFVCSFNNVMSMFTFVGYVPFVVQIGAAILGFASWLYFHVQVQWTNMIVVSYGAAIASFSVVFGSLQRSALWNAFKATQELERERQFLDDVQRTLHNLLSTLFDASCTCDAAGAMLTGTPQLEQLLGDDWNTGLPHVTAFSSSENERDRLSSFLKALTTSANHNTQTLHTSFVSVNTKVEIDAKIIGIKLPDREGRDIAFIGLQTNSGDVVPALSELPECSPTIDLVDRFRCRGDEDESLFSLSLTEVSSAVLGARDTLRVHATVPEGSEPASASASAAEGPVLKVVAGSPAEEPEVEEAEASEKAGAEERQIEAALEAAAEELQAEAKAVEAEETASEEPRAQATARVTAKKQRQVEAPAGEQTKGVGEKRIADVAAVPGSIGLEARGAAVSDSDTDGFPARVVSSPADLGARRFAPAERPPLMPSSVSDKPRSRGKRSGATQGEDKRVVLKTSKKLLPGFKETPAETVRYVMLSALVQFNSRGRGCCSWHVQLAVATKALMAMSEEPCWKKFSPLLGWQCAGCQCLNAAPEVDDDGVEEGPECSLCGNDAAMGSDGGGSFGTHGSN